MKHRYFVVDAFGQLRRASDVALRNLWEGTCRADAFGSPNGNELRLVSVVCDKKLLPQRFYLLRLPLTNGVFSEADLLTLQIYSRRDCMTADEVIRHHIEGWPTNFFQQLAVALDTTMQQLDVPMAIGGPLLLAAAMSVTPDEAVWYLR